MEALNKRSIENKIINGEKLTESELKLCAWGEVGNFVGEQEGKDRCWTRNMSTIFEICGQLYRINWEKGLTECQDNEYWEQPYKVRREEKVVTLTVVSYIAMED